MTTMARTVCSTIQQSLAWCQGTPELPGIKRRIYYISKDQIVSWPVLTYDSLGRLTSAAYSGSFVLAADATWKFIDILPDKSQLTSDPQGEFPSQTQLNKLVAVHPSVGLEASALSAYVNNNDCVYLVETVRGQFRVVGSDKWQVKSTVAQDLGQGATGTTSTTLNVEATDECPAPFYYGEIVTEDGVINEEDDGGSGGGTGGGTINPGTGGGTVKPFDGNGGTSLNPTTNFNNENPPGSHEGGGDDGNGEEENPEEAIVAKAYKKSSETETENP
jgi:hypothetical protein